MDNDVTLHISPEIEELRNKVKALRELRRQYQPYDTALQDGMLQWYLSQAPLSDANVEEELRKIPLVGLKING